MVFLMVPFFPHVVKKIFFFPSFMLHMPSMKYGWERFDYKKEPQIYDLDIFEMSRNENPTDYFLCFVPFSLS